MGLGGWTGTPNSDKKEKTANVCRHTDKHINNCRQHNHTPTRASGHVLYLFISKETTALEAVF